MDLTPYTYLEAKVLAGKSYHIWPKSYLMANLLVNRLCQKILTHKLPAVNKSKMCAWLPLEHPFVPNFSQLAVFISDRI